VPRLVHLSPDTNRRAIERAGLRGRKWPHLGLERAVFAMPLMADFAMSHQWLRELRSGQDARMIAVHFVAPGDETVLVGHYGAKPVRTTLTEAIRAVMRAPSGNQIVLGRAVRRREIVAIRELPQLVGWTRVPPDSRDTDCVCSYCLRPGDRRLMRRVRGEIERRLTEAQRARTPADAALALERADIALERAGRRVDPKPWLRLARSREVELRLAAAKLLRHLRPVDVRETLTKLLVDEDPTVWRAALHGAWRVFGAVGALVPLARASADVRIAYVNELGSSVDVATALPALERMLDDDDFYVREAIRQLAIELLSIDYASEVVGPLRERVEGLLFLANERTAT
jgi:hypothetical protein